MILESSRPCVHTRTHFPVLHIAALPLVTIFQYIFSMVHLMKASIENQNNTCAVTSLFLLALVRRERSVDDSPASSGILRCLRRLSGSKEMNVQIPNGRDIYIYVLVVSRLKSSSIFRFLLYHWCFFEAHVHCTNIGCRKRGGVH